MSKNNARCIKYLYRIYHLWSIFCFYNDLYTASINKGKHCNCWTKKYMRKWRAPTKCPEGKAMSGFAKHLKISPKGELLIGALLLVALQIKVNIVITEPKYIWESFFQELRIFFALYSCIFWFKMYSSIKIYIEKISRERSPNVLNGYLSHTFLVGFSQCSPFFEEVLEIS